MTTPFSNPLRTQLASGRSLFGVWLGIPDSTVAEIMAGAGFDWLLIDHEHAPFELRDILTHLQVLAAYDVTPIVRPVNADPALLKKLCDVGVQNFIVPMVDTAEEAAAIVQAVKYPPEGRRGLGTSLARAARWNATPGYVGAANDQMCIVVQAETETAMTNLDAIVGTPGIDGVFIGPSDLSASMGHVGNVTHPDVDRAISSGLATIRKAGKLAGVLCLDPSRVSTYIDAGANFVGVGVDTLLIGNAARRLAAEFCETANRDSGNKAGY